jgi:hypothetical protein
MAKEIAGNPCQTPGCDGILERRKTRAELCDDAGEQWCPRRSENPLSATAFPGPDRWQRFKSNGNRVCSYCGSLHPEDMFALVKQAAERPETDSHGDGIEIEPSDKRYKVYVHQPGVRNASEGGIKFYMMHLPRAGDGSLAVTDQHQAEFVEAVRRSRARFEARFKKLVDSGVAG